MKLSHATQDRLVMVERSKRMPNLDSMLKSRDITLPTKVPLVKAMVFPVEYILSDLSTMTHPSWVASHGMT